VERLGGNRSITLDVRVIAATNRPPREAVRDNRLREDLYYRLNVFSLDLPPLRERLEDLPELVRHFVAVHAGTSRRLPAISDATIAHLSAYRWPGNVRELANLVERALILSSGDTLEPAHFPLDQAVESPATGAAAPTPQLGLDVAVKALETKLIQEALRLNNNNKTRAAQLLQISERSIWYKIKKYNLGDSEPV
jgi:two-component system response regulator AtoC